MSAAKVAFDLFNSPNVRDTGNGTSFLVDRSPYVVGLISTGSETRTLLAPTKIGAVAILYGQTIAGTITITVTGGYDEPGSTTLTITEAGQFYKFEAVYVGSTLTWRLISSHIIGNTASVTPNTTAANKADVRDENGSLVISDGHVTNWGTDSDVTTYFDNTRGYMVTKGGTVAGYGPWSHGALPSRLDPNYHRYANEFHFDAAHGTAATTIAGMVAANDGGTGTNAYADVAGGVFNLVTAAADNDYHAMTSLGELFLFASGKPLWFEARFRLTEATTNESAWWFGLTDTLTTGGFQANTSGPLASYDGVLIWKDEGDMLVDFETSNAGTQATTTNMGTFVSATWTRVGFFFDGTATTSVVTPYVALADGAWTAGTAQNITLSGLEEMHLVFGVKAGPTAGAETLQVDYVRCVQLK